MEDAGYNQSIKTLREKREGRKVEKKRQICRWGSVIVWAVFVVELLGSRVFGISVDDGWLRTLGILALCAVPIWISGEKKGE